MDRAEAKGYRDISAMLSAGVSLETALGGFAKMYGKDAGLPLRAMGFFKDGDLPSLPKSDQDFLRSARDRVSEIPEVAITLVLLRRPLDNSDLYPPAHNGLVAGSSPAGPPK
jgi:hypothetical protein